MVHGPPKLPAKLKDGDNDEGDTIADGNDAGSYISVTVAIVDSRTSSNRLPVQIVWVIVVVAAAMV
jgi:hypothetical protein